MLSSSLDGADKYSSDEDHKPTPSSPSSKKLKNKKKQQKIKSKLQEHHELTEQVAAQSETISHLENQIIQLQLSKFDVYRTSEGVTGLDKTIQTDRIIQKQSEQSGAAPDIIISLEKRLAEKESEIKALNEQISNAEFYVMENQLKSKETTQALQQTTIDNITTLTATNLHLTETLEEIRSSLKVKDDQLISQHDQLLMMTEAKKALEVNVASTCKLYIEELQKCSAEIDVLNKERIEMDESYNALYKVFNIVVAFARSVGTDDALFRSAHTSWKPDNSTNFCEADECPVRFGILKRKHHCRRCGHIFCSTHVNHTTTLNILTGQYDEAGLNVRICNECVQNCKVSQEIEDDKTING